MYDNSLKVPTAIRWPGVTKPGTTITSSVTQLDWFPTMVAIAQGKTPQDKIVRGRNLSALLQGQQQDWDNDVFTTYSTLHQSTTHMRCFRTPQWKLIRDFLNPERDELFDLQNDPEETTNVINNPANQAIIAQLHERIIQNMQAIDDPVLKTIR
jgi:uncharacterized sulfatase